MDMPSIMSGPVVLLSLEKYDFDPDILTSSRFASVQKFKVLSTSSIDEHHVEATYRASFKEVGGDDIVEISGKWKGTFYNCVMLNKMISVD